MQHFGISPSKKLKDLTNQYVSRLHILRSKSYHPVIKLPEKDYEVLNFEKPLPQGYTPTTPYTVGRYDEVRLGMYHDSLFEGTRNLHVGIDLGAPVGTPVYSFWEGSIHSVTNHSRKGDYGPTIITKHEIEGIVFYALFGHLSLNSIKGIRVGQVIDKGAELGKVGNERENGHWAPHVHFQISMIEPQNGDMPGVVSSKERERALSIYPDPRIILGQIY